MYNKALAHSKDNINSAYLWSFIIIVCISISDYPHMDVLMNSIIMPNRAIDLTHRLRA